MSIAICSVDSIPAIHQFLMNNAEISEGISFISDINLTIFEEFMLINGVNFEKAVFFINKNTMILEKLEEKSSLNFIGEIRDIFEKSEFLVNF